MPRDMRLKEWFSLVFFFLHSLATQSTTTV